MDNRKNESIISEINETINTEPALEEQQKFGLSNILEQYIGCELEKDSPKVDDIIRSIEAFYEDNSRHSYAEIFIFLSGYQAKWEEEKTNICDQLELIDNNVSVVELRLNKLAKNEEIIKKYKKLKDHISLETARIKFWYQNQSILKTDIDGLRKKLVKAQKTTKTLETKSKQAIDDVNAFRTTQVTILTIFVAILLMLVTDLKFSTSIIEIANQMLFHRVILLISFGGMVALNLSFALLLFIANIINKDIQTNCKSHKCINENSCSHLCNECHKTCWVLTRLWKRYPYIVIINGLFIVIIVTTLVYYYNKY